MVAGQWRPASLFAHPPSYSGPKTSLLFSPSFSPSRFPALNLTSLSLISHLLQSPYPGLDLFTAFRLSLIRTIVLHMARAFD